MGWFVLAAVAIVGALLLDNFGLAYREPRPITLGRAMGAAFIMLGVAVVLWFPRHRP